MLTHEPVFAALERACDNGYEEEVTSWSARVVALDMCDLDPDFETVDPRDLVPHIEAWQGQRRRVDAVQEQGTAAVDVRQQAKDGEEVGKAHREGSQAPGEKAQVMVKTQTVLELQKDEYEVRYDNPRVYASPGGRDTVMALDAEVYRDLGSPLHVTVTVEPGDLLN